MPTPVHLKAVVYFMPAWNKTPLMPPEYHQNKDSVSKALQSCFPRNKPKVLCREADLLYTSLIAALKDQNGIDSTVDALDVSDFTITQLSPASQREHSYTLEARITLFEECHNPFNGDQENYYQFDITCQMDAQLSMQTVDSVKASHSLLNSCTLL